MITRRQAIKIVAGGALGLAAFGYKPRRFRWEGIAFGGQASLIIEGDVERAQAAIHAIEGEIRAIEGALSLFQSQSALSRLNESKSLHAPGNAFMDVLSAAKEIYQASEGRFDPSIGGIWRQYAQNEAPNAEIGLDHVKIDAKGSVFLPATMELSFNGIAQGYASDRIKAVLADYGFQDVLVDMGEIAAGRGRWVVDTPFGRQKLSEMAIATSHAEATLLPNARSHILSPQGSVPLWQEVSVMAENAMIADGWSTAFMLLGAQEIVAIIAKSPAIAGVYARANDGRIHYFKS